MRQAASDGESTVSAQMAAVVERLDQKLTEMVEARKGDEGELVRLRRQLQEQQEHQKQVQPKRKTLV